MRTLVTVVCLFLFTQAGMNSIAWSAEIPNGIYQISNEEQGRPVVRSTGGSLNLGDRIGEQFGEVSIWSLSNQNDRFRVWMKQVDPVGHRGHVAIYIDGVCEVVSSQGKSEGSDKVDLIADISGKENGQKIAKALNTKLTKRKHPGYLFAIHWKPLKQQYKLGEAVQLELTIENVGEIPVYFMEGGQNRGPRDNQFGFVAFSAHGYGKTVPDTGSPINHGGLAAFRTLKPGEVFRKKVDITKWFQFKKADTYQITGSYELDFHEEDFNAREIWKDFVTGRCLVTIVD